MTTFDDVDDAIEAAIPVAVAGSDITSQITVDYAGNCTGGGTVMVAGTYQSFDGAADLYGAETSNLMFTFAACSYGDLPITGAVAVDIASDPSGFSYAGSITGSITGGGVTSCVLNVSVSGKPGLMAETWDGTVCGNTYQLTTD